MTFDFYQKRISHFQSEVTICSKIIRQFAWSRVLLAGLIILFVVLGYNQSIFFYPIPLFVIGFFYFVSAQQKKESERTVLLFFVELNQAEAKAINFDFSSFSNGNSFIAPDHVYSHDLDIFGAGSVFQYINRCATQLGEAMLATDLTSLHFSGSEIIARQEAIRELAKKIEFRQQCWSTGKQINDTNYRLDPLLDWLKESDLFLGNPFLKIVKWALPASACASLIGIAFNPIFQSIFLFLFILQLVITSIYSKPITLLQNKLANYRAMLENYTRLFQLLRKQECTSLLMKKHQQFAEEAADHVREFSKRVNSLETRMNLIARMFGNGIFCFDLHSVSRLEAWRKDHATALPQWLQSLAEWDALLSFATLHFNQPTYAFAEVGEHFFISGSDTGHLLIPTSVRVNNSFDLGKPAALMLTTGANMAGKSTFLRAIGVNYILGLNGSPVCATQWHTPLAKLRTGMRTSDSLQENQSYFFAELNRLQSIIQELRSGHPMVILLDEILKGTNSTDKQTGSRELIKQLIQQKALMVIATHDIALGDMEQQFPTQISNACFEGKIENDQLTFDYKLNKGLAQKANATFLMQKMGIIPQF